MYNFTIIIPHHNIPLLLLRCLKTIPNREDIQVVIIDDNSDYFNKNELQSIDLPHLEIIEIKESRGAGAARNEGLKVARGKWILFADADDFFNDCLEDVLDSQVNSIYDLIVFDSNAVLSNTLQPTVSRDTIVQKYKKNGDEYLLRYKLHTVWGKMFKKDIIDKYNILFSEVPASNDVMFAGIYGHYAVNILFIDLAVYCCTTREGSICTKLSYNNLKARFDIALQYNSFLYINKIPLKYGENALGFAIKLCQIKHKDTLSIIFKYLKGTIFSRIVMDIIDSTGNLIVNFLGINKDKDMKRIKKIEL